VQPALIDESMTPDSRMIDVVVVKLQRFGFTAAALTFNVQTQRQPPNLFLFRPYGVPLTLRR
jgi:hypothetical protein